MNDNRFDDILRSKLSGLKTSDKPDWHAFDAKRKKQLKDTAFDDGVRRKLHAYEEAYNPNHWQMLSAQLGKEKALVHTIKNIKYSEIAIMLLLLLSIVNYLPWQTTDLDDIDQKLANNTYLDDKAHVSDAKINNEILDQAFAQTLNADDKINARPPLAQVTVTDDKANIAIKKAPQDRQGVALSQAQEQGFNDLAINTSLGFDSDFSSDFGKVTMQGILDDVQSLDIPVVKNNVKLAHIDHLGLAKPLYHNTETKILDFNFTEVVNKPEALLRNALMVEVSYNQNYFLTPQDIQFETTARTTEMYGYAANILYGRQKNNVEFITGFGYRYASKPWKFSYTYGDATGFYAYELTNISFDMLTLPLELRYHFASTQDWSIFGKAGIQNNIILNAVYESENTWLGGAPIPGGPIQNPDEQVSPFEEQRTFNSGILNGDKLSNNYFANVYAGIGLERKLNANFSIYFTGDFRHHLFSSSIGPNSDKLNTFSFGMGLKTTF